MPSRPQDFPIDVQVTRYAPKTQDRVTNLLLALGLKRSFLLTAIDQNRGQDELPRSLPFAMVSESVPLPLERRVQLIGEMRWFLKILTDWPLTGDSIEPVPGESKTPDFSQFRETLEEWLKGADQFGAVILFERARETDGRILKYGRLHIARQIGRVEERILIAQEQDERAFALVKAMNGFEPEDRITKMTFEEYRGIAERTRALLRREC